MLRNRVFAGVVQRPVAAGVLSVALQIADACCPISCNAGPEQTVPATRRTGLRQCHQ
jgi:hypothetical protein